MAQFGSTDSGASLGDILGAATQEAGQGRLSPSVQDTIAKGPPAPRRAFFFVGRAGNEDNPCPV